MNKTKEKILVVALDLFNRHGTRVITTNHIAEACDMSPGNLYYHYKNKEQIIFALFEKMIASWDSSTLDVQGKTPNEILDAQLDKTFSYVWKYRFIHRELAPLLDKDVELKKMCNQVLQRRLQEVEALLGTFEEMGMLKPLQKDERSFIAHTALYYGLFWQPFLEVVGEEPTKKNVLRGVEMIRLLLKPYCL